METLKQIIPKINEIKTNFNGTSESYYFTLIDIYKIAEPKIEEICLHLWTFKTPIILKYESPVYPLYYYSMVRNNVLSFYL